MTMQDNRTLGADLPLLGNTAANGAGTRQKKRTAKSCTACRQSKVSRSWKETRHALMNVALGSMRPADETAM